MPPPQQPRGGDARGNSAPLEVDVSRLVGPVEHSDAFLVYLAKKRGMEMVGQKVGQTVQVKN